MIAETPEDFRRRVQIHCRADMVEGDRARDIVGTWLDRAHAHLSDGVSERFAAKRVVAADGHGFDEALVIAERSEGEGLRGIVVPLLSGWPLRGDHRPAMGDLPVGPALEAVERIRSDMRCITTTEGDVQDVVIEADRSVCIDVAAMMTILHPSDDDELIHEKVGRVMEVAADRLTGLPHVRMVDSHYSDDDVQVEDRIGACEILRIYDRHVLHLELRNDREDPGLSWFVVDRLGDDSFRTQNVDIQPLEAMRIHASIVESPKLG